ncbi:hypothetical protein B0T18DRAFT_442590 [Schizothecium vesticola]|uniref:DUF3074 domain-containing protein n=1 Tax=Schizothecium vesticola TaxID=314040 RepID=A0AA40FAB4_9PEZI|nr:hypothetical protein B0T18DRAFT_442590 [Schizothecium vesticola]
MSTPPPPQRTLLTLSGLSLSDLPPPTATADVLAPFLTALLAEAIPLVDSLPTNTTTPPTTRTPTYSYPWTPLSPKSYPPTSTAPVHLYSLNTTTGPPQGQKEIWIARLSIHTDASCPGTASFQEFQTFLKDQHVDTEANSTPSVEGVWRGARWTGCDGVEVEANGTRWTDFTISALAARHRVGRPVLRDRVFPVVQVTCSSAAAEEGEGVFLVVSLHVEDLLAASSLLPGASDDDGLPLDQQRVKDRSREDVGRGAVVGAYVSVERVRRDGGGSVEWIMATASDAKGVLPLWVQTRAVPGQVAVDVPYFLGWVEGQR